jgi:hypothetical protein
VAPVRQSAEPGGVLPGMPRLLRGVACMRLAKPGERAVADGSSRGAQFVLRRMSPLVAPGTRISHVTIPRQRDRAIGRFDKRLSYYNRAPWTQAGKSHVSPASTRWRRLAEDSDAKGPVTLVRTLGICRESGLSNRLAAQSRPGGDAATIQEHLQQ